MRVLLPLFATFCACGSVNAPVTPDAQSGSGDGSVTADAALDAVALPACANELLSATATTQALYHFNDATGSIVDDASSKNRNGGFATVSSGPTWTDGKFGGALAFVGGADFAGDRVDVTTAPAVAWGNAFTVEAFIKPSMTDVDGIIVSVNPVFALWRISSDVYWRLNSSSSNLVGPALDQDRWYYVATTYDGTTMRIYVDGQQVAMQALASVQQGATDKLYLGCAPNDGCYSGVLDEVRISTGAISAAAIAATAAQAAACQ